MQGDHSIVKKRVDANQSSLESARLQDIVSLCKRRGFVFPGSEIYGGLQAAWDYGPLGVELRNNLKRAWWESMTFEREDIVGIDSAILMARQVWQASGHEAGFNDPMVDCKNCKGRFRADLVAEMSGDPNICPNCGQKGTLTEPRQFNLMFKMNFGPVADESSIVYLRPETAQGIYVNFKNVQESMRRRLPFGIAQIGKAFRNEIVTANFIFRMREFEQMEMQFFVAPGTEDDWFERWRQNRWEWYRTIGIKEEHTQWHQHGADELAHYAKAAWDVYYEFPFGAKELEGIHNRTDFDLNRHSEYSGKELTYYDDQTKQRYIPYVVETSVGADRLTLAILCDAYDEDVVDGEKRVVMRFHKRIAPVKVAVMPLSRKDELIKVAKEVRSSLRYVGLTQYDDTGGNIGKRYRRQDEIGTPYCVTVDFQSLEDNQVTIRDRDTTEQRRVPIVELAHIIEQDLRA
jgi:glycyl-tRNA synthetase